MPMLLFFGALYSLLVKEAEDKKKWLGHYILTSTSVSEWKFIIASAFKFTLLRQPEAAGQKLCCLVDIFILAVALTTMVRATASWAETSGASIFRFSIAVSRLVLQHRK